MGASVRPSAESDAHRTCGRGELPQASRDEAAMEGD